MSCNLYCSARRNLVILYSQQHEFESISLSKTKKKIQFCSQFFKNLYERGVVMPKNYSDLLLPTWKNNKFNYSTRTKQPSVGCERSGGDTTIGNLNVRKLGPSYPEHWGSPCFGMSTHQYGSLMLRHLFHDHNITYYTASSFLKILQKRKINYITSFTTRKFGIHYFYCRYVSCYYMQELNVLELKRD